jgi:hypothetical protein
MTVPANDSIGQGVVRRLTHTEYNNTVKALLGTALTPAAAFPGDVGADGFDNASGPQTVVANHLTAFEGGSDKLIEAAFLDPAQRARLVSCDLATGDACVRASLEGFLRLVLHAVLVEIAGFHFCDPPFDPSLIRPSSVGHFVPGHASFPSLPRRS